MQEDGIPIFITVIASTIMVIGVMVAMAAVTWAFLLMLMLS